MGNLKPSPTPMEPKVNLHDDTPELDAVAAKTFHRLIGSLHYLTLTRPDIAYSASKMSQFLTNHSRTYWTSLQRICRYLSGTLFAAARISGVSHLQLRGFSDVDWAGDTSD